MEHKSLEGDRLDPAHILGREGHEKGDLSKFIEEAVRWRVFHRTVQDIKSSNAVTDPGEIQRVVDEAVAEVRAERRRKA